MHHIQRSMLELNPPAFEKRMRESTSHTNTPSFTNIVGLAEGVNLSQYSKLKFEFSMREVPILFSDRQYFVHDCLQ